MNKTLYLSIASLCVLAACQNTRQEEPAVGMANPASVFCVEQNGRLEMQKDQDGGEYALCHLPDGTVVEEWAYFRAHHK